MVVGKSVRGRHCQRDRKLLPVVVQSTHRNGWSEVGFHVPGRHHDGESRPHWHIPMLSARSTRSASSYESDRDWASCHSEILASTSPRELACANMWIFQLPFGTGTQPTNGEGNRTHWPGPVRLIRTEESGVAGSD